MNAYTPQDPSLESANFHKAEWEGPDSPWTSNEGPSIDIFPNMKHHSEILSPSSPSYSHSFLQHGALLLKLQIQIQQEKASYALGTSIISPTLSDSTEPSLSDHGISNASSTTSFTTLATETSPLFPIDDVVNLVNENIDPNLFFDFDFLNLGDFDGIGSPQQSLDYLHPLNFHLQADNIYKSEISIGNQHLKSPKLSGTSIYLSFLFPLTLPRVSTSVIERILHDLRMPLDQIALAGCLIDALSNQFFRSWLNDFPLNVNSTNIHPETILLVALVIAVKFLNDHPGAGRINAERNQRLLNYILSAKNSNIDNINTFNYDEGITGEFSSEHFNITADYLNRLESSILRDLDYNILGLMDNDGVEFMSSQFRSCGPILAYD